MKTDIEKLEDKMDQIVSDVAEMEEEGATYEDQADVYGRALDSMLAVAQELLEILKTR